VSPAGTGWAPPELPPGARLLVGPDEIQRTVDRLGQELRATYTDGELTLVVVLQGALVFAADLLRRLTLPVRLETVNARSYVGAARSPGALQLALADLGAIEGRHVLVVDDILDTGRTLAALLAALQLRRPASLRSIVLLDKPARRQVALRADFTGMTVPDAFVVGYGLDHDGLHRNLPCLAALAADEGAAAAPAREAPSRPGQPPQSQGAMGAGRRTNNRQPS